MRNRHYIRGFTLTEIVVVLVIIVVLIGIGVGAWKAMSGAHSVEAAQNTISAYLGRVREEALSGRKPRGVVFYEQGETTYMATVYQDDPLTHPAQLDIHAGTPIDEVQTGIGARFISNGVPRYRTPGILLFDGSGQLQLRTYSIRPNGKLGQLMKLTAVQDGYTHLGVTLFQIGKYERVEVAQREPWLDSKGKSLFVNRYSGTLVEGRAK